MSPSGAEPSKWALLIGIDLYPNLPGHDLSGCVADALALSQLLHERYAFPSENISLLLDQQATRAGILQALSDLLVRVRPGDVVVVSYSGHGSQVATAAADSDEEDGLNETLVAHDSGRGEHPNRDILDDELRDYFFRLGQKTHHVTVIFDCCHSGSGLRDAFGDKSRGIPADLRPLQPPPSPSAVRDLDASRSASPAYVFIAGCRDDERSFEYTAALASGSCTHGALTFFLCQELSRALPTDTISDVFERAAVQVTAARSAQHPQIEGNLGSAIFGTTTFDAVPSVRVRSRNGAEVLLGAGLVHGVTVGSQWSVRSVPTPSSAQPPAPIGLLDVKSVGAVTAVAAVLSEAAPGAVAAGARAVEESRSLPPTRLSVQVIQPAAEDAAFAAALLTLCQQAAGLAVTSDAGADARISITPAREGAAGGASQHPQLDPGSWAVVGREGTPLMPALPLGDVDSARTVVDNLSRLARQRAVLAVDNLDPKSALRGQVTMELWVLRPAGWERAVPETQGCYRFREGQRIAIAISNRAAVPVYLNLLSLGVAGGIDLVHPPPGASSLLLPGKTLELGRRDGEEIELFLPDDFPFSAPEPGAAITGSEWLKLFVSQQSADFAPVLQRGVHREIAQAGPPTSPKTQPVDILDGLLSGHRDIRVRRSERLEDWLTITCTICTTRPAADSTQTAAPATEMRPLIRKEPT